jgi:hypothetical protein
MRACCQQWGSVASRVSIERVYTRFGSGSFWADTASVVSTARGICPPPFVEYTPVYRTNDVGITFD